MRSDQCRPRAMRVRCHGDNIAAARPRDPVRIRSSRYPERVASSQKSRRRDLLVTEAGTSLSALVRAAAERRPDAPAVVTPDRRLSWAELDAAVDRVAAGYAAQGLEPGQRVAVQLPNGADWLCAALGALRAGLVVVPVNTTFTDPELEHVLGNSGASLLVASSERSPVAGVPVCAGPPENDGPVPAVDDDPDAIAFLAYTSGTTGRPRGAMLTHRALRANQEQCLAMDTPPVREDDRVLVVLPLFHV